MATLTAAFKQSRRAGRGVTAFALLCMTFPRALLFGEDEEGDAFPEPLLQGEEAWIGGSLIGEAASCISRKKIGVAGGSKRSQAQQEGLHAAEAAAEICIQQ